MRQILFTNDQAVGAWPNGAIVLKANSQPKDASPDGTAGYVVGSVDLTGAGSPARFGYFVIWKGRMVPVFVADTNNDGTPRLELAP